VGVNQAFPGLIGELTEAFHFAAMSCQVVVVGRDAERRAIEALFAERESAFSRFLVIRREGTRSSAS